MQGTQALIAIRSRLGTTKTALELGNLLVTGIRRCGHRTALLRRLSELTRITLLDAYYDVWRVESDRASADKWSKITVAEEGGQFKLHEN